MMRLESTASDGRSFIPDNGHAATIEIAYKTEPMQHIEDVTLTAGDEVFHIKNGIITQDGDRLKLEGMSESDKPRFHEAIRKLGY